MWRKGEDRKFIEREIQGADKNVKTLLFLHIIKEMQIKTTKRCHFTYQISQEYRKKS